MSFLEFSLVGFGISLIVFKLLSQYLINILSSSSLISSVEQYISSISCSSTKLIHSKTDSFDVVKNVFLCKYPASLFVLKKTKGHLAKQIEQTMMTSDVHVENAEKFHIILDFQIKRNQRYSTTKNQDQEQHTMDVIISIF